MANYGAHDNIAIIHAVFGSLLALFIVPSGILIARYRLTPPSAPPPKSCCAKKSVVPRPQTWLHLHILCNVVGVLGVLLVFSLGIASVLTAGEGIQFTGEDADVHHCLGLALTVLMVAQGVIGWWAHRKPSGRGHPVLENNRDASQIADEEKGALAEEDTKAEATYPIANRNDGMDDIEILDDLPLDTHDDGLMSGQGRGCCSGSDPTIPGGCACSMSNLNGAPCCCGGKGDRDDVVAKESPRGGRNGEIVRRRSGGLVKRLMGKVVEQQDGPGEVESEGEKRKERKHPMRWLHGGLGLVIAAGLYWETWNGLNLEYASMSISLTTVPQSVQIIFWLLFLIPVGAYVYSIGDEALKGLGRMTIGVEEEERLRKDGERRTLLPRRAAGAIAG